MRGIATAAPIAVPMVAALAQPADGPITPAEYLAEMQAIGGRPVASLQRGKPDHVIEHSPDYMTLDAIVAHRRIATRISKSGDDFWKRTSRHLFEVGLVEEVAPQPRAIPAEDPLWARLTLEISRMTEDAQ